MTIASMSSARLAVDLGSANTLVYLNGRGVAVEEPSVVRLRAGSREVEAVGSEARSGSERTPPRCETVMPVRQGRVCDPEICSRMLNGFMKKLGIRRQIRPMLAVVSAPGELSEVQEAAVVQSFRDNHVAGVFLTGQALAAAVGAGIPIAESRGNMIVDVGAGVTEVAVISLSNVVTARTVPAAGDDFDAAIENHIRTAHHLLIGRATAERVKLQLSLAPDGGTPRVINAKGRCLSQGIPREVRLNSSELTEALNGTIEQILGAVRDVLNETPPELSSDLVESGIVLTGGSAHLTTLAARISESTGLQVRIAEQPRLSVILGLAHQLERLRHRDWRRFGHPL
jgi:rod shape-determining protein MreB and related proteins